MDLEGIQYIDISPVIKEGMAVYPRDVSYVRRVSQDLEKGDVITLSSIETSLHIGAHADAPSHYEKGGEDIGVRSLDYYMGPCQVIDVSSQIVVGGKVLTQDFERFNIETSRVLIKTSSADHYHWKNEFATISKALMLHLVENGVKLVGIDTPSIDAFDSRDLECHKILSENNMAVLEGLDLSQADEGKYQIIALPLKIDQGDASPVRAILVPHE